MDLLDEDINPGYELDEHDLTCLYMAEFHSLANMLDQLKDEKQAIRFLREAFDHHRVDGGDTQQWVIDILHELDVNPQLFPPELRGPIAENVQRWEKEINSIQTRLAGENENSENELPPVEVEPLKSAANYVVLLHELGILEHLKNRYPNIPAQRLGELCERITGQETDYFRQAFPLTNINTNRAFNDKAKQKIKAFLLQFGIEVNEKSKRN